MIKRRFSGGPDCIEGGSVTCDEQRFALTIDSAPPQELARDDAAAPLWWTLKLLKAAGWARVGPNGMTTQPSLSSQHVEIVALYVVRSAAPATRPKFIPGS